MMQGAFHDGYVLARGSARYPACLEDLPRPPAAIYVRGDAGALSAESMSVIGSRRATPYGIAAAELAARCAVDAGLVVVSGGAMGCDAAAGAEALGRGGRTVVVLGTGADVAYPRTSAELIARVAGGGGAVVSLEPWGAPPRRYAFPKRNRVIAALSRSVFIAEAGMPSGTFSTAEAADQIGREVLVAPGPIFSPESAGSNYLISIGATCVADERGLECAISRVYGRLVREVAPGAGPATETPEAAEALRVLTASPLRVDDISSAVGLDVRSTLELLSELTLDGLVERLDDGRYAAGTAALHARTSFGQNG